MKRSTAKTIEGYFRWKEPIYWRPDRAGYTEDAKEAGIYTSKDVERCAGCKGDWVLEPVSRSERFGDEE